MFTILTVYHRLNVLLGVINIHYNPTTNCYNLYHWPTIIYCAAMNLFCTICLHAANYIHLQYSLLCYDNGLTQILEIVLIVVDHLLMVVAFAESWLKRRQIFAICNDFKMLYDQFCEALRSDENRHLRKSVRNIIIRKFLCIFLIICYQLYEMTEESPCQAVSRQYLKASNFFVEISFFCMYFLDINIYLCWTFIYMCEASLQQRLKQMANDVKLIFYLQTTRKDDKTLLLAILGKWRKNLSSTIMEISRQQSQLRKVADRLFNIFQLQLLLICTSFFFNFIYSMVFAYLVFANFDQLDMQYLIIFIVTFATRIQNVFIFFNMNELLATTFNKMGQLVHQIDIYASKTKSSASFSDEFDRNVSEICWVFSAFNKKKLFTFQLELLMLQVQPHQFCANICGLFVTNNSNGLQLLEASLTSVISLIQILAEM